MSQVNRLSITQTVARQTPKNEFGQVLKNTITTGARLAGQIVGGIAGMPIVSAAVSSVTALAGGSSAAGGTRTTASAASGIVSIGGSGAPPVNGGASGTVGTVGTTVTGGGSAMGSEPVANGVEPQNFDSYLGQMRAESDRSMAMQMQMQQESRDYNTLSNVIKVRHDSAKAAINNIR